MKLLITSDSHGRVSSMQRAVERERPDRLYHLGDVLRDLERLEWACPNVPMYGVLGNCDGWAAGLNQMEVREEGVRLLLTHGHLYRVKSGLGALRREGERLGVQAALFGHTHQAMAERTESGLWLINPGSIGGVHAPATYAVLTVDGGALSVELKEL